jgi:hypothetical protein
MNKLHTVVVAACLTAGLASSGSPVQPEPPRRLRPLPDDLYHAATAFGTALRTPLERIFFNWDSASRRVILRRASRADRKAPWSDLREQVIEVPFDLSVVLPTCDATPALDAIWVAGAYDTGGSTVEKWTLAPAPSPSSEPLRVCRSVLYRGTGLGIVADLAVDPQQEFLLVLTYGTPRIFRLPKSAPSVPVLMFDADAIPRLADAKTIDFLLHRDEGPMYVLDTIWRYQREAPPDRATIVLRDRDRDGVVEGFEVLSDAEWGERGYEWASEWVLPCREED